MNSFQPFQKHILTFCMLAFLGFLSSPIFANNLFVGRYLSETRENFGRDKLGEYEIAVTFNESHKIFDITISQNGKLKYTLEGTPCIPEYVDYLNGRPEGKAEALCNTDKFKFPILVFSENGIRNPAPDYSKDPEKKKFVDKILMESGVKPFPWKPYIKTQYYAYVEWGFYGFRKVQ